MSFLCFSRKKQEPVNLTEQRGKTMVRGKFDSAQTTANNRNHWANADGLSPDAAANPAVRKIIMNRARYEVANNNYAGGINKSLANYLVGTGPRLQLQLDNKKASTKLEKEWKSWGKRVRLARKLNLARRTKGTDGEYFSQFINNPKLKHKIKLDFTAFESEMCASNFLATDSPLDIDGIKFDKWNNPISYRILKDHPGSDTWSAQPLASTDIQASKIIHWFFNDRPGQHRGVSELASSLSLYSQMRRYTLATLDAAETASNNAGVIYSDVPVGEDADDIDAMDEISLQRNMFTTMPLGWKMGQMKAEQPTTTHNEFKNGLVNEIGRGRNVSYNVAAGNSSGYNYASARLDHQDFFSAVRVERDDLELIVVDRILEEWLREAVIVFNIPMTADEILDSHVWFWDGLPHIDPVKEANAQKTRLNSKTTTLAIEWGKDGKDYEAELLQLGKEDKIKLQIEMELLGEKKKLMKKYNLNDEDLDDGSGTETKKTK